MSSLKYNAVPKKKVADGVEAMLAADLEGLVDVAADAVGVVDTIKLDLVWASTQPQEARDEFVAEIEAQLAAVVDTAKGKAAKAALRNRTAQLLGSVNLGLRVLTLVV